MNLSNAVYNFAFALVEAAGAGNPFENSVVHADIYEEMNGSGGAKFIRVGDLIGSTPQPVAPGVLKEFGAVLDVQFLQIPANQTLAERLAARETVDAMALYFIQQVYDDQRLGAGDCNIIGDCSVRKMNDWRRVGNAKTPISIVRLSMNKI